MKNNGLFSSLFIDELKNRVKLDDAALGRMATLTQTWQSRDTQDADSLWESFMKQALGYLEFVPSNAPASPGVYPLYEDWSFNECISVLYLCPPGADIDDTSVGRFYPAKLMAQLKQRKRNWGILTDGARWRLYSTKSSRPYEDFVELPLSDALEKSDEAEYGLFERFFHRDSFIPEESNDSEETAKDESVGVYKCRLDHNRDQSESVLEEKVKKPFLSQVDEVLQYICNGFIVDTKKTVEEYTEAERAQIFESAVKLIYRCLFLFYAEARRLLPTDSEKADLYRRHSIEALCREAHKFRWGQRRDTDQYDLWKHLKGLISAVNDGDPEYGIMGYDGGLFDDEEEWFLGQHQLRNDFLSRALYLLAYVEPHNNESDGEYAIPYEDLEVRHLGELYENILEYTVLLADADRIRRRTKKGTEILLASQVTKKPGDTVIRKGEVYFGESALERKQTGSYYTPESLVRFLNEKTIIQPLVETFEQKHRKRFDELVEQAQKGYDVGIRRGASQSAAALVERFAEEDVLNFKVCDPAMGSGHFLVDATNQMTGLLVGLLEEVPYVKGMTVSISSCPNDWRRRITRYCIYGVDLNPLAVNLAKLSLWLNCFAIQHRLTFLDHHLRCGNSLIGIRSLNHLAYIPDRKKVLKKKDDSQSLLFDYDDLSSSLAETVQEISSITEIDEDDTDSQKAVLDKAQETAYNLKTLADLYTSYLMDPNITAGDYKYLFELISKGKIVSKFLNPRISEILEAVEAYRDCHRFYHWPLEFPDVFGPGAVGGFSGTIGNPPWDAVKPNSQEFFSAYDPKFRSYRKQEANKVAKELRSNFSAIEEIWKKYCYGFSQQSIYFKEPLNYTSQGKGDVNTFKLFSEQMFELLAKDGYMGIIIPSGFYTDHGCQPLRVLFFERGNIAFLYCFENRNAIFNIHRSFKFITLCMRKGHKTDRFKCAFMEHDPERLPSIDANALCVSIKQIKRFSPDTLSIMEFKNQSDVDIVSRVYKEFPLLGDHSNPSLWHIGFRSEFHVTNDSHLFQLSDFGLPMFEGKCIWQYDTYFSKNQYYVDEEVGRKRILGKLLDNGQKLDYQRFRLVYRKIARSTDERTIVSSIIPASAFTAENLTTGKILFNVRKLLFVIGVLNSFCQDFLMRLRVSAVISMFHMYQVPLPRLKCGDSYFESIVARAARLLCVQNGISDVWNNIYSASYDPINVFQINSPAFWYPDSASINNYGPAHEIGIRQKLRDEANYLTAEWEPHCGVYDRLPDRRDTGDRAQLRAEIDAYVAHLYGLSRDDFSYILDTFPVLKKKEEKVFGEFMSKRKCLEEYDRLRPIVEGMK